MTTVDHWLIERAFEPASWRLSRWFGLDAFTLARFLLVVNVAGVIAMATITWRFSHVGLALLWLIVAPLRMLAIASTERAVGECGSANPEKHSPLLMFFRLVLMGALVTDLSLATITLSVNPLTTANMAYSVHLYFAACDAPPPTQQMQANDDLVPEGSA